MTRFETWLLRRALRRDFSNGLARDTTTHVQRELYAALVDSFQEDNRPTTEAFMRECFEESLPDWFNATPQAQTDRSLGRVGLRKP